MRGKTGEDGEEKGREESVGGGGSEGRKGEKEKGGYIRLLERERGKMGRESKEIECEERNEDERCGVEGIKQGMKDERERRMA